MVVFLFLVPGLQFWLYNGKRYLISLSSSDIEKMIQLSAISELKVKCIESSPNFQVLHISMNAQLTYKPIVLWHFQPDGLNVVNGLIFLLLRFSALIILFQESISLRCKRSCLRLVTGRCGLCDNFKIQLVVELKKKMSPTCVSTSQVNFIVLIVPQSGTKTWCRLEFISRIISCATNKLLSARVKTKPWWWQKLSIDIRRISNKFPFNTSLS